MQATDDRDDVLLIVPLEPMAAKGLDPAVRQTLGARLVMPLSAAVCEFEQFLGQSLNVLEWTGHPLFGGGLTSFRAGRSLTAVTLATHLQRHGLRWAAIDPGVQELRYWRRQFEQARRRPPRIVAVSTTFTMTAPWLRGLCGLLRRILPQSRIVVGGWYYQTDVRQFLSLDADAFCIGEGERRLPQIVAAVRDGRPLDDIPGLYLRTGDGGLHWTGRPAPLVLDDLEPPDWSLAARIEPSADLARTPTCYGLETQRGCGFKCEFCTFRTLAAHEMMSAERAADAIARIGELPPGCVVLADATATAPHARWREIMRRLADRGGSRQPLVVFARVSDVDDQSAELMWRAGVRGLLVGQESGDQQLLDAMHKGIRVEQVPRAVAAMAKWGLGAYIFFIHGFPGEDDRSLANTRAMIIGLNDACPDRPAVWSYNIGPFFAFDFAPASRAVRQEHAHHYLGYEAAHFAPGRVAEELLRTLAAASRVPHAPVCGFLFNTQADMLFNIADPQRRMTVFRWLKAYQRGVAVFLEREMDGTPPDLAELRRLRTAVQELCPPPGRLAAARTRFALRGRIKNVRRVAREWEHEAERGPGPITRSYAAWRAWRDFGRLRDALGGWRCGTLPDLTAPPTPPPAELDRLAVLLTGEAAP